MPELPNTNDVGATVEAFTEELRGLPPEQVARVLNDLAERFGVEDLVGRGAD
jgi:hypothetical protein